MIINQPKTSIATSGIRNAVSFGIKQEGLAHIFNVLRNQLYSNKIMAVLREYSCNAVDAHTEAGNPSRPIRVTLPNRLNLELRIRDFGNGLSDQDIQQIYAFYGESTKRQSNSLIGQLGLGSKSAFAYGDNFVINSFHNGIKTSYNAYIDASQVGQIAQLYSNPSEEESGVEIVIPININDILEFENTAKQVFQFFPIKPEILGAQISFDNIKSIMEGNDWKIVEQKNRYSYSHSNTSIAIMGNIGYSINFNSLKFDRNNEDDNSCLQMLNNASFHINFKIGDLDIAASREGLQYTDRTINAIKSKLLSVRADIAKKFEDELTSSQSLWSAKKMVGSANDMAHPFYIAAKCLKNFNWKNHKNISSSISFQAQHSKDQQIIMYVPRRGYVGGSYCIKGGDLTQDMSNRTINLNKQLISIENTKKLSSCLVNYAYNYLKDSCSVIIFTFKNANHRKEVMDAYGMTDSDLIDMATLTKITLPRNTRSVVSKSSGGTAIKSKHSQKYLIFDTTFNGRYTSVQSDYWKESSSGINIKDTSIQKDYVWVGIDRFLPLASKGGSTCSNSDFGIAYSCLNKIGEAFKETNQLPEIIGVKKPSDKFGSIQHIKDFVLNHLKMIERKHNLNEIFARIETRAEFTQDNQVLTSTLKNKKLNHSQIPNAVKLWDRLNDILTPYYNKYSAVHENFYTICKVFQIKPSDVFSTKISDELTDLKNKLKSFGHTMRILKIVDAYSLSTHRDTNGTASEMVLDLISSRESETKKLV